MSIFIDDKENEKVREDILKQSLVKGRYISLNLSEQEKTMKIALVHYNNLCDAYMPEILKWNHIDLHKKCPEAGLSITDWKDFLMDARVQAWINDEIYIMMRSKSISLLDKIGDDRSTATVQALTALMKSTAEETNKIDDGKIFVYCFMPLTQEEERLNHAQVLSSIPDEVRLAIQKISAD